MATCDRCGRKIKYPLIIRKNVTVGFFCTVFNVKMDDYNICPRCAESFNRWLYSRISNKN